MSKINEKCINKLIKNMLLQRYINKEGIKAKNIIEMFNQMNEEFSYISKVNNINQYISYIHKIDEGTLSKSEMNNLYKQYINNNILKKNK